jgi:hypothetical protein
MPLILEDTIKNLSLVIFKEKMPHTCIETVVPGTSCFTVTCTTAPHMRMAACVCKMWRKDFQKYVKMELLTRTARIHVVGSKQALKICNCDEYADPWDIPKESKRAYYLRLDQKHVFSMTFIRRRVAHSADATVSQFSPAHELLAQYRGPEEPGKIWPVYTIEIPRVCWVPASVISDEARTEYQAWHPAQLVALRQWLAEQYAELLL